MEVGKVLTTKEHPVRILGPTGQFCIFLVVVISQINTNIQTPRTNKGLCVNLGMRQWEVSEGLMVGVIFEMRRT